MILEVYAGKKKVLEFVPYFGVGEGRKLNELPDKDRYAIHGGKICSEKQVRTWANQYGYTIKQTYQKWDLHSEIQFH